MRVVLDGQALVGGIPTGFGVYAHLVAEALELLARRGEGFAYTVLRPQPTDRPLAAVWQRVWWEQCLLPVQASRIPRPALLHSPCLGAPLLLPLPLVCTVHDLILLDEPPPGFFARQYFQRLVPAGWRRARLLLTDSEEVRSQVVARLRMPGERVLAVPLYSRYEGGARRGQPPQRPQFLLVGTLEPRKGFATALGALAQLPQHLRGEVRLLIAGSPTPHLTELKSLASRLGVLGQVSFAAYTPRLDELYRSSTALLFPSLAEGFGLPPLEAMSLGVPVLISGIPVLRETYGQAEGRNNPGIFPPGDEAALAALMRQAIEDADFAARLVAFGDAVARRFTRTCFAESLFTAYRRALAES